MTRNTGEKITPFFFIR